MTIETFVFFDLETTGLPAKGDPPKITELTFISVSRRDLEQADCKKLPPVSKLTILFNPQKKIHPEVVKITGLSNKYLLNQPIFKDRIKLINMFLDAPKPVCLVAHNGNRFDYKIFNTEYENINEKLPQDLLCLDSLKAFKDLLTNIPIQIEQKNNSSSLDDEWPDLDVTPEDWKKIDNLTDSFSELASSPKRRIKENATQKISYKLTDLYKTLTNKVPIESHRAEADCLMLLECAIATKQFFLPWADNNYNLLNKIKSYN